MLILELLWIPNNSRENWQNRVFTLAFQWQSLVWKTNSSLCIGLIFLDNTPAPVFSLFNKKKGKEIHQISGHESSNGWSCCISAMLESLILKLAFKFESKETPEEWFMTAGEFPPRQRCHQPTEALSVKIFNEFFLLIIPFDSSLSHSVRESARVHARAWHLLLCGQRSPEGSTPQRQ